MVSLDAHAYLSRCYFYFLTLSLLMLSLISDVFHVFGAEAGSLPRDEGREYVNADASRLGQTQVHNPLYTLLHQIKETDQLQHTGYSENHIRTESTVEKGIPKLSHEEEQLLNALVGGLGPVILPIDQADHLADDGENPSIARRRQRRSKGKHVPEQIHIAFGNAPSEMVVMWSTPEAGSSEVLYGPAPNNFTLVEQGTSEELFDWYEPFEGVPFIHRVKLTGLTPGASYSYKVKTQQRQSDAYTFTTMRDGTDWSPTLLVYGDMGRRGGAPSLRLIKRAAQSASIDAIIHVGDFAYDLHDEGGRVGDDFMNRLQDVAAFVPYMTCPGNHEIAHNFIHYKYRFSMPWIEWPMQDEMWYSFDMGNVHFISYSTEVYFTGQSEEDQILWLTGDLQRANQERDVRPWVIVFGHRPMYCSNNDRDDCTKQVSKVRNGLEDLFYDNGVDMIIEAHEHSYERFWPMHRGHVTAKHYVNPVAPVHVISGAAGCNEFDGICVNPILGKRGEWSAYRSWLPGLEGFGRLHVANATHLRWEQRLARDDVVEDEFWIEQHNHGYFPPHL